MRKPPQHKDIRTLGEIIAEHREISFVLHKENEKHDALRTSIERLQLLERYAALADSAAANDFKKLNKEAWEWYGARGFPAFVSKDYRNDDQVRVDEIVLPIIDGALLLKRLLIILRAWRNKKARALLKIIVPVDQPRMTVEEAIEEAKFEEEYHVKQNREINSLIIRASVQNRREKKYKLDRGNKKSPDSKSPALRPPATQVYRFKSVDLAWYADYKAFLAAQIEPYALPVGAEFDDATILDMAEDQLIKAANIMLRGIQPAVRISQNGEPAFFYKASCDWHIMVTAFAEVLTNDNLKLRFCDPCGADISDYRADAVRCRECAEKKRR